MNHLHSRYIEERANCAVTDSHFVAGVYIFHSLHLLHQHQFSLPANHTLVKNYYRKQRLSKHGHSFPLGQIASYQPLEDAFIKKTRGLVIFLLLSEEVTSPAVRWQSHQVRVVSSLPHAMFSQTFSGTLPLASPRYLLLPDGTIT